jgi:hypothetical protein
MKINGIKIISTMLMFTIFTYFIGIVVYHNKCHKKNETFVSVFFEKPCKKNKIKCSKSLHNLDCGLNRTSDNISNQPKIDKIDCCSKQIQQFNITTEFIYKEFSKLNIYQKLIYVFNPSDERKNKKDEYKLYNKFNLKTFTFKFIIQYIKKYSEDKSKNSDEDPI